MNRFSAYRLLRLSLLLAASLTLSACGSFGSRTAGKEPTPPNDSPFQKSFAVDAQTACAAANRALLGDGYLTDALSADKIKGRKSYRTDSDRSTVVEMTVVCLPDPDGGSTLYANGLRSTYDLKKSATPASIGVSVIGSVSLPIGQSADSMVKTTDETITEREFYRKFFASVDTILHAMGMEGGAAKDKPIAPPTAP
ncbi:MAG: DUF2242 domain-containing protein [Halothiobacillaceae bacterium]|jgi:uncharacterized protein YceK